MLAFVFLLLSAAWSAEHCEMELPVQDQDGLNICYAASASLMRQATDPQKRPMSFIAAGILASGKQITSTISGTEDWATNACSVINRMRTCPAEFFPLEGSDNSIEAYAEGRFLSTLGDYFKGDREATIARLKTRARQPGAARDLAYLLLTTNYSEARFRKADGTIDMKLVDSAVDANTWASSACGSAEGVTLPADKVAQAQALLDAIQAYDPGNGDINLEFLRLIAPRCAANLVGRPDQLGCKETNKAEVNASRWSSASGSAAVSASICRGLPVTFNSCARMMSLSQYQPSQNAEILTMLRTPVSASSQCANKGGGHVMTVVGTRDVGGQVQYLVQNSWGRDCRMPATSGGKFAGLECQKDADGRFTGRTWVPQDIFQAQAYRIGFMN